jgi:hypothetical protein
MGRSITVNMRVPFYDEDTLEQMELYEEGILPYKKKFAYRMTSVLASEIESIVAYSPKEEEPKCIIIYWTGRQRLVKETRADVQLKWDEATIDETAAFFEGEGEVPDDDIEDTEE